jgi:hypothetical protein
MANLEERSLGQLADIIFNVMRQDLLEVFRVVRQKMDIEGPSAVRNAFSEARSRFLEGPFKDQMEVRWGMNLCPLCNDDNIEKNGIAYLQPNGDGLEFNQCLNCRIGILYGLKTAAATMDSYVIGLGNPASFNGMSFYWVSVGPDTMESLQPVYEVVKDGQWIGSVSFNSELKARYLPFAAMQDGIERGAAEPWTSDILGDLQKAIQEFVTQAKEQIEVALVL